MITTAFKNITPECTFFCTLILTTHNAAEINAVVKNNIDINNIFLSDHIKSYFDSRLC